MTRVQLKRVNFANGNIYRIDDVVEMESNQATYALGMGDVIASAAGVSTPPTVPPRLNNSPTARVSRAQQLLKDGVSGFALSASDNQFFSRNGALELIKTVQEAFGAVRTGSATCRDSDTGLLTWGPENLALRSQEADNASWNKFAAGVGIAPVVTANAALAPDGTLTADKLDFSLNGGTLIGDQSGIAQSIGIVPPVKAVCSVYLRADAPTSLAFRNILNNGTYTILNITTEWQRFELYGVNTVGTLQFSLELRGTVTSVNTASVYFWGAQIERGQTVASPYKPTTATYWFGLRRQLSPRLGVKTFLCEEQRINLALRSQELDNAIWPKTNCSIIANNEIGPDGLFSADAMSVTVGAGSSGLAQTFTGTVAKYTFSIWAKAIAGSSWIRLNPTNNGSPTNNAVWFNLATGAIGTIQSNVTVSDAQVESWGNGWYRCSVTLLVAAVTETFYIRAAGADGDANGATSQVIALFGAQIELGTCLSSYAPTLGSSGTRLADLPVMPISSLPYNSVEGTIYAQVAKYWPHTAVVVNIAGFTDAAGDLARLYYYSANRGWNIRDTNVDQCDMNIGSTELGVLYKIAGSYKLNDFDFAYGGVLSIPDNSGTIGVVNDNFILSGIITEFTEIAAYTTKLADARLQELTA